MPAFGSTDVTRTDVELSTAKRDTINQEVRIKIAPVAEANEAPSVTGDEEAEIGLQQAERRSDMYYIGGQPSPDPRTGRTFLSSEQGSSIRSSVELERLGTPQSQSDGRVGLGGKWCLRGHPRGAVYDERLTSEWGEKRSKRDEDMIQANEYIREGGWGEGEKAIPSAL
jgi:hypothetical protein